MPVIAQSILSAPKLRWLGYLSTVGVYGNYGGAWVSEATTPHPDPRPLDRAPCRRASVDGTRGGAQRRRSPFSASPASTVPGRNAFVNLEAGKAHRIVKPGQVFNRIHVDDIVATLGAALRANAGGIFNVADDEPAPPQDVVAFAADLDGGEAAAGGADGTRGALADGALLLRREQARR